MALILLIEDNYEIRENSTELLELEGHVVVSAENGRVGIDKALENKPDLILCDIMMPELNGYEVLTALKKNSSTSAIPFVFVTASTESKDVKIGMDLGADGYIRKPFEVEELTSVIERFLSSES